MGISIDDVKKLRDETGVSIMQCKKALEEVDGDHEKALIILKKKSSEIAAKKADRDLAAGTIGSYLHTNGAVAALVVLSCETDFVSKNEEFVALAKDIAMHVTAMNPSYGQMSDVPESEIAKVKEVFMNEVDTSKPTEIQEKILEGKVNAHFSEQVLMNQAFVKDPGVTIGGLIEQATQKFGERVDVTHFTRIAV